MTAPTAIMLTAETIGPYLARQGIVPPGARLTATELGGGISNTVIRASWPETCIVIKQALPKLRVDVDWPFNPARNRVEQDCMTFLPRWIPATSAPSVVFSDDENYTFGMTCAPPGGVLWKDALLSGQIDLAAAHHAGTLLAWVHQGAARDPEARDHFASQTVLLEGRIDPYHRTAARAHPDLAPAISAEVDRLLATRATLVLGDYSPKNIFAYEQDLFIIDFEVAHWGDPAFDVAFLLTHLVLKAARFAPHRAGYIAAASRFWHAYRAQEAAEMATEHGVVAELGCLLLARIDGKSRAEYITDGPTKDKVRGCARRLLLEPPERVDAALLLLTELLGESA